MAPPGVRVERGCNAHDGVDRSCRLLLIEAAMEGGNTRGVVHAHSTAAGTTTAGAAAAAIGTSVGGCGREALLSCVNLISFSVKARTGTGGGRQSVSQSVGM